mmetsp:Transcript_56169/g.168133  ORF Transcript_56169/g.168133 Transcript_56169/m.168133 type:complete len:265 (+) Transcript_56169:188-982(+)
MLPSSFIKPPSTSLMFLLTSTTSGWSFSSSPVLTASRYTYSASRKCASDDWLSPIDPYIAPMALRVCATSGWESPPMARLIDRASRYCSRARSYRWERECIVAMLWRRTDSRAVPAVSPVAEPVSSSEKLARAIKLSAGAPPSSSPLPVVTLPPDRTFTAFRCSPRMISYCSAASSFRFSAARQSAMLIIRVMPLGSVPTVAGPSILLGIHSSFTRSASRYLPRAGSKSSARRYRSAMFSLMCPTSGWSARSPRVSSLPSGSTS